MHCNNTFTVNVFQSLKSTFYRYPYNKGFNFITIGVFIDYLWFYSVLNLTQEENKDICI